MPSRVLITGSRDWSDTLTISSALKWAFQKFGGTEAVLVSGNCPTGADHLCETYWRDVLGGRLELHPADWNTFGKSAGFRRNAEMVNAGADVCLAFIKNQSKGASHTADLAERAGMRVVRYVA